jgi:transcriptional regulator with XRE-family HTH domain
VTVAGNELRPDVTGYGESLDQPTVTADLWRAITALPETSSQNDPWRETLLRLQLSCAKARRREPQRIPTDTAVRLVMVLEDWTRAMDHLGLVKVTGLSGSNPLSHVLLTPSLLQAMRELRNAIVHRGGWAARSHIDAPRTTTPRAAHGQVTPAAVSQRGADDLPPYALVARELREITGLETRELAQMVGVQRESYSRWTSGKPITSEHLSQLNYLDAVLTDARRRVGERDFRDWLHRPVAEEDGGLRTPRELLLAGQARLVYRIVAAMPDPNPPVRGKHMGLRPLMEIEDNDWD